MKTDAIESVQFFYPNRKNRKTVWTFEYLLSLSKALGTNRLSTLAIHAEALGFNGFFVSDHYHVWAKITHEMDLPML